MYVIFHSFVVIVMWGTLCTPHYNYNEGMKYYIWYNVYYEVSNATAKISGIQGKLEMWANAPRDGRPVEYRWRPLLNAAKFGSRPVLECCAVMLTNRTAQDLEDAK